MNHGCRHGEGSIDWKQVGPAGGHVEHVVMHTIPRSHSVVVPFVTFVEPEVDISGHCSAVLRRHTMTLMDDG